MVDQRVDVTIDGNGRMYNALNGAPAWIGRQGALVADDVQGDANPQGTLIANKKVEVGQILLVTRFAVFSKAGASVVNLAESANISPDGTQTDLATAWGNVTLLEGDMQPVCVIDNSQGSADRYLLVYAPANSAGAANNPNTQYWNAHVNYLLL